MDYGGQKKEARRNLLHELVRAHTPGRRDKSAEGKGERIGLDGAEIIHKMQEEGGERKKFLNNEPT